MNKVIDNPWVPDEKIDYAFEPSVLMQIYKACRKNYPARYSGSLLGLSLTDDANGDITMEITDIVSTNDKTAVLNIAKYIGNDCEVVGYFKSSEGTDHQSADMDTIEALKAVATKSKIPHIMITCDPMAGDADQLNKCFKIERIGPNQESPLVPVKVETNTTALQKAFLFEWSFNNETVQDSLNANFGPLRNGQKDFTSRNLNSIYRSLDDITSEQEILLKNLKEIQRHSQRVNEWMEKRRLENQNRYLEDRDPLPCSRAAAIKAVGECPTIPANSKLKGLATVQSLVRTCEQLSADQKDNCIRQKVISNAF